jgi:hypothetical protein
LETIGDDGTGGKRHYSKFMNICSNFIKNPTYLLDYGTRSMPQAPESSLNRRGRFGGDLEMMGQGLHQIDEYNMFQLSEN